MIIYALETTLPQIRRINLHYDQFQPKHTSTVHNMPLLFENLSFLIDEKSFKSKVQLSLLKNSIVKNGGKLEEKGGLLVENGNEVMKFIQDSIANKKLMNLDDYIHAAQTRKRKASPEFGEPHDTQEALYDDSPKKPKRLQAKLMGGKAAELADNPNKNLIEEFQDLHDWYAVEANEKIRKDTYARIINALKQYPHKITSGNQVKALPGIGAKTVVKIQEILDQKPDRKSTKIPPYVKTCKLFQSIYGVGPTLAKDWYDQGHRTLDDIKPLLNSSQLKYFNELEDMNRRIPRDEIEKLGEIVKKACKDVDADCEAEIMGSYRRGAKSSSDIDILVYPTTKESLDENFMQKLIECLGDFVISTLKNPGESNRNTQTFQGICALSSTSFRRRLDIWTAPKSQIGSFKLQLTGNTEFSRGLSLLAHEKGMTFSRHGMCIRIHLGLKKNGEYITGGRSEREILEMLGLEYKSPEDRNS